MLQAARREERKRPLGGGVVALGCTHSLHGQHPLHSSILAASPRIQLPDAGSLLFSCCPSRICVVPRIRYEKVEMFYGEDSAPHAGLAKTRKSSSRTLTAEPNGASRLQFLFTQGEGTEEQPEAPQGRSSPSRESQG